MRMALGTTHTLQRKNHSRETDGGRRRTRSFTWSRMKLFRLVPAGALLLCILTTTRVGASDRKPLNLDEVVVTASPVSKRIDDITSAVSVIDEAEIDASTSDYVMDVIGRLPGVYIRRDAIYGRQAVEIRGLGSNCRRIQTLVDGRPEKMCMFGCTVTQTLPLSNVERIEVVRGPESILYGADAMGGVVNIVTRKVSEPGFETDVLGSYGSYDSYHGQVRHGGNTGKFDYYATYDHKQTDGHRANSEYDADFFSLRSGYQVNESWRMELSGQYFRDDGHDPGPENNPYTSNDRRKYKRYSWDIDLKGEVGDGILSLTFYDNAGEHTFNMPSIEDYWHSKDNTMGLLSKYTMTLLDNDAMTDKLTLGYEYQNQWADPQDDWVEWARANMLARFMDFGSYTCDTHDFFAFNEITRGRWINTLGLRAHYDTTSYDWEALPQVGLLCHVTELTTARAKVSKGFRQPRFSELYLFPAHNAKLDPEEVWSYELALSHAFCDTFSAFANPFYMDVRNMIQQEPNDNPPPNFLNSNSGKFYIRGVETGFEYLPFDPLSIGASYTYTDVEDSDGMNANLNREGKPEHVINAVCDFNQGRLGLSLEMEYVAGLYDSDILAGGEVQKVDDFFVANVKGTFQAWSKGVVFAGIENVLDEDYEQIPGYPMPGTTFNVGLRITL